MIDLELWRARIGLYHAACAGRRSKQLKRSSRGRCSSATASWGSRDAVDDIPFALRSCIAAVLLVLVLQCILNFIKKQHLRKALSSFLEASYRVVKTVLTSGVPFLLKVCVVMIPLLLLLAGDVERNPGPTERTIVCEEHMPQLTSLLDELAGDWDLFMLQLGLPSHEVEQIRHDNAQFPKFSKRCLVAGLNEWIRLTEDPTYERIATVLRGKVVTNITLVNDVEFLAKDCCSDSKTRETDECSKLTIQVAETRCSVKATSSSRMLMCGCGKCPLFKTDNCRAPTPITFPEMSKISLTEEKMDELAAETVVIDRKFHKLVTYTTASFEERKVPQSKILSSLSGLNSFTPCFKGEQQPLVSQLKNNLEKAKSISEMISMMDKYISFFDFYIIEHLIDCCGNDHDKDALKTYKDSINDYLARRIYKLPSKLANSSESQAKMVVKLDSLYEQYSAVQLKLFENELAEILYVSNGVILLCDVKSGCFELTFQVPSFIAEAIFPLSAAQERELPSLHVLRLSCGGYHWPRQDCQSGDESPKPPDDDDAGSLEVQLEQAEVMSKGDPPDDPSDDGDSALGTSLHTDTRTKTFSSKSCTCFLDMDDTLKEFMQLKERDAADAKREDKPMLHSLAYVGDIDAIKSMIASENVNPESLDHYGNKPLHQATFAGHIDIVKYLIKEVSCQPASPGNFGRTPLHYAAMYGHFEIVKYLVEEEGLDPSIEDIIRSTPLHQSAFIGHMAITEYLSHEVMKYRGESVSGKGTDSEIDISDEKYLYHKLFHFPDLGDIGGHDPLHYASLGGHVQIIDMLVSEFKFDPHAKIRDGKTALHIAAECGNLNVVKCLIEKYKLLPLVADPEGFTPLHSCAGGGHLHVLKHLIINQHCDPMFPSEEGASPLHIAAMAGRMNIVKYLVLQLHCDQNIRDQCGNTPLHYAAQDGCLHIVKCLVRSLKCDPNSTDRDGKTPLHTAARNGQLGVVKWLIEKCNCSCSSVDQFGISSLHSAAIGGHQDIMKYFIVNQNCDPMSTDKQFGISPLHCAAQFGQIDVIKYLTLQLKCDLSTPDGQGYTPLHYAAITGNEVMVEFLVCSFHCDVNARNSSGRSVLHEAAFWDHLDVVKCMIEKLSCMPMIADENGYTPLHYSAGEGHLHIVKYLITEQHCNPIAPAKQGITCMHLASLRGQTDVLRYLMLDLNCDRNIRTENGFTLLHSAAFSGQIQIIELLVSELNFHPNNFDHTLLHCAAKAGKMAVIEYLTLEFDCDPNIEDIHGNTALHVAAEYGHEQIVEFFTVQLGCDINSKNKNGITAIRWAAHNGNLDTAKCYIEKLKCDPNSADVEGATILHIASVEGHMEFIKYLTLDVNCDPNVTDCDGNHPLHYAAQNGQTQVVEFLVKNLKCDPNSAAKYGVAVLHTAVSNGHLSTVKCLIETLKCNKMVSDQQGSTALHYAAAKARLQVVKYLIVEQNYEPLHVNHDGITVLHCAAGNGHVDVLKYLSLVLSKLKCDLTCRDKRGLTALHHAAMMGHLDVVKFLTLKGKCDPEITTNHLGPPLYLAIQKGHLNIVRFYIEDLAIPVDIRGKKYKFLIKLASHFNQPHILGYLKQKRYPCKQNNTCIQM